KFFAVTNFGQIIVFVDVYPKFDFLELGPRRPFVFLLLGDVVAKLAEIDNFADWRISCRRDFDNIETETLRFAQGVVQFHDAELLTGGPHDDPDFAGANPTVYTNLWLQIKSSSWVAAATSAMPRRIFVIAI